MMQVSEKSCGISNREKLLFCWEKNHILEKDPQSNRNEKFMLNRMDKAIATYNLYLHKHELLRLPSENSAAREL